MGVTANVKGYVGGNAWGVYDNTPSLLTYEEVVSMATTEGYPWSNTISELNNNPEYYYNLFNDMSKMAVEDSYYASVTIGGAYGLLNTNGRFIMGSGSIVLGYNTNTTLRGLIQAVS